MALMALWIGVGVTLLWFQPGEGNTSNAIRLLALVCCFIGLGCGVGQSFTIRRALHALESVLGRLRHLTATEETTPISTPLHELTDTVIQQLDQWALNAQRLQSQVEDLQIQTQLSQQQKKNIEEIIYSLQDAVLVVDDGDRLLLANPSAATLFGFDRRVAEHETLADLLPSSAREFVALVHAERKNHSGTTRQTLTLEENGEYRIYDCYISCLRDSARKTTQVVAVMRDVTREKEVAKIKNDFVSYVSHELKTPLASITAYVEMLLDGEAGDETMRQEFYTVIQSQAKRLNRLIENILNVSRIESGLMKIEKEPVSLTILVDEQLQMIRGYADDRNVRVIGQKPIVFDQVYADRDMMTQVIVNLLSNAIKYNCPGGSVTVETEVDETLSIARVSVHDSGVGIPEEELDHVFEKFYRVQSNEERAEGTGLGLSLVQQIVEKLHNGRVFVKSKVGAGSTFGFELPLATRQDVQVYA